MFKLSLITFLSVLFLLLSTHEAYSSPLVCADLFAPVPAANAGVAAGTGEKRVLENIREIRLMTFNAENMYLKSGNFKNMSMEQFENTTRSRVKPPEELREIAKAIREENPDFILFEEVEGRDALTQFSDQYLGSDYVAFGVPGNDSRGIQIGFLVKKDLPLDIELESHKDMTYKDGDQEKPLFSRDLPALIVRRAGDEDPLMLVLATHAKAKIDRNGDPQSTRLRTLQMVETAHIIEDYQQEFGADVPIILGGDFNIDIHHARDVDAVKAILEDTLDIANVEDSKRTTHTYHPRDGAPSEFGQLDAIFVTPNLHDSVIDAHVYRYKDARGNVRALPRNHADSEQNPSDHFPVVVTLSTAPLFKKAM